MNPNARTQRLATAESAFLVLALTLVLLTDVLDPVVTTILAVVLLVGAGLAWGLLRRPLRL